MQKARIFTNGRSQAVRLPKEFRFDGTEVYIRRDALTGDVILSRAEPTWGDFWKLLDDPETQAETKDFMAGRRDLPPARKRIFR